MKRRTGLIAMAALSCGPAMAQPFDLSDWTIDTRADAIIAFAPGRDSDGSPEAEMFAGQVRGEIRFERVLDNGAEIGARLGGVAQLDHPARAGFSGRIGDGTAALFGPQPRGAFTGLTLGGPLEDTGVRAQLETAFVYIDGGYGELLAGRDIGIARRFHEGAPSVFNRHRVTHARLDTSGLASVLTRNDLTGPAAKISYATPRLLGVRLGGSYTPRANVSGLDRDPDRDVPGVLEPRLEDGLETAVNISRRLQSIGANVEAYGAYSRANLETGPLRADTGTVEVWSSGGRIAWDRFELGADWLTTDNGAGRYKAWSVGGQFNVYSVDFSVEYGESSDRVTGAQGEALSIGAAKTYFEKLTVAAGLQRQALRFAGASDAASTAPVIEMTLKF